MAFSSEPRRLAALAKEQWGLTFPVLADTSNALAQHLIDEKIVPNLFISDTRPGSRLTAVQRRFFTNHPFMQHYLHGCTQPSLAIVHRDGSVPFSMAVYPEPPNGMGAAGRPDVRQVWAAFESLEDPHGTVCPQQFRAQSIYDETYIRVLFGLPFLLFTLVTCWFTGLLSGAVAAATGVTVCLVGADRYSRTPAARFRTLLGGSLPQQLVALLRFVGALLFAIIASKLPCSSLAPTSTTQKYEDRAESASTADQQSIIGSYSCPKMGIPCMAELPPEVVSSIARRSFRRPFGLERWIASHGVAEAEAVCKECIAACAAK